MLPTIHLHLSYPNSKTTSSYHKQETLVPQNDSKLQLKFILHQKLNMAN